MSKGGRVQGRTEGRPVLPPARVLSTLEGVVYGPRGDQADGDAAGPGCPKRSEERES